MKNTVIEDLKVDLRMSTAFTENGVTCFAMDNMAVKKSMVQPTIKSIGYDNVENPEAIPAEKETITVFMSHPINSENVTDKSAVIYFEDNSTIKYYIVNPETVGEFTGIYEKEDKIRTS